MLLVEMACLTVTIFPLLRNNGKEIPLNLQNGYTRLISVHRNLEEIMLLTLEYPAGYEVDGLPNKVGLSLPQSGGRFIFDIQNSMNKLSVNNSLLIAKPVFTSQEYHYLKELFNNVLAVQQTELVFKKKK